MFPPYLSTFIISIFVSLNMCLVSYFVDGTTVDGDSKFGWFGLFRDSKFILFMYMSMMLSLGVFLTSILISKLFEPIVPATALLFEPIVTSILIRISHVQDLPGSLSVFGYCFILPG